MPESKWKIILHFPRGHDGPRPLNAVPSYGDGRGGSFIIAESGSAKEAAQIAWLYSDMTVNNHVHVVRLLVVDDGSGPTFCNDLMKYELGQFHDEYRRLVMTAE